MDKLKELESKLKQVEGTYPDFYNGVLREARENGLIEKLLAYISDNPFADTSDILDYVGELLGEDDEPLKLITADSFRRAVANLDKKQKKFIEKYVRKDIFDLNKSEDELEHAFSEVVDTVHSIFLGTVDDSEMEKITGDILDIFDNELEDQ